MSKFKKLSELKDEVEEKGGAACVTMGQLRDALGYDKLGVHVRTEISRKLAGQGLGHKPAPELPDYQHQDVLVYSLGSKIAQVVDALDHPSEEGARKLVEIMTNDAKDILDRIKALLGE
jgi:hypothetical protein